jgi:hypothetical protein
VREHLFHCSTRYLLSRPCPISHSITSLIVDLLVHLPFHSPSPSDLTSVLRLLCPISVQACYGQEHPQTPFEEPIFGNYRSAPINQSILNTSSILKMRFLLSSSCFRFLFSFFLLDCVLAEVTVVRAIEAVSSDWPTLVFSLSLSLSLSLSRPGPLCCCCCSSTAPHDCALLHKNVSISHSFLLFSRISTARLDRAWRFETGNTFENSRSLLLSHHHHDDDVDIVHTLQVSLHPSSSA